MEKILVIIDKYSSSTAIWTAYKKHIFSISKNFQVELMIDENVNIDVLDGINDIGSSITTYSGTFGLYKKIATSPASKIYLPHILLVSILSPLKLLKKELYLWLQGILPEESYLKNKSKARLKILSHIENYSLRMCSGITIVSNSMLGHINKKYGIKVNNHLLIPCLSDLKYNTNIEKEHMSFVYVGGASEWQKIDLVLSEFKKIKEKNLDAKLDFISKDKDKITNMISDLPEKIKSSIKIYSINNRDDMERHLSLYQYGFLFRDNIEVNNVSSPIKFCEYISCGIKPIISDHIGDYSLWVKNENLGIVCDHKSDINLDSITISPLELVKKYDNYCSSIKSNSGFMKLFTLGNT